MAAGRQAYKHRFGYFGCADRKGLLTGRYALFRMAQ
jgi:hypothetical protein